MNCNANHITTQNQVTPINQHIQPQRYYGTELTSLASALKNDYDYLTNARLYSTPISRSVVDLNNNRIALSKYSGNHNTNYYFSKFSSYMLLFNFFSKQLH